MGAHALGKVSAEDSDGYHGVWTPGQADVFNTTYYEDMISTKLNYTNRVHIHSKKLREGNV